MKLVPVGKKWIAEQLLFLAELFLHAVEDERTDKEGRKFAYYNADLLVRLAKRELK